MIMEAKLLTKGIRTSFIKLRPRNEWSFRDATRPATNAFTHGYHRYPAKFIPQIVKKLVEKYAPAGNELICDPFGGCGTTLVEAKLLGRKSIGFDINPIAKLITQTKVTPIKPISLDNYRAQFLTELEKITDTSFSHHPRISYWFDEETVIELDKIYAAIKELKNPAVRRFFLCAFSHSLKNCSRWLMKSIKPTIDKDKKIPNPQKTFLQHLDSMIKKNEKFYNELVSTGNLNTPAKMLRRDSTRTLPIEASSVDLIITSPPYVTSYEYADLHQLSLLWFGDDPSHFKKWHKFSRELQAFRKNFIGTAAHSKKKNGAFDSLIAQNIVTSLTKIDRPLAIDVANYFLDMKKVFAEMFRTLKKGGKACIIIGNTSLHGIDILNAEVAAEQMLKLGFRKVKYIKREVSNKMITPWRDKENGKFTGMSNPNKKRTYESEYVIIMEK